MTWIHFKEQNVGRRIWPPGLWVSPVCVPFPDSCPSSESCHRPGCWRKADTQSKQRPIYQALQRVSLPLPRPVRELPLRMEVIEAQTEMSSQVWGDPARSPANLSWAPTLTFESHHQHLDLKGLWTVNLLLGNYPHLSKMYILPSNLYPAGVKEFITA